MFLVHHPYVIAFAFSFAVIFAKLLAFLCVGEIFCVDKVWQLGNILVTFIKPTDAFQVALQVVVFAILFFVLFAFLVCLITPVLKFFLACFVFQHTYFYLRGVVYILLNHG